MVIFSYLLFFFYIYIIYIMDDNKKIILLILTLVLIIINCVYFYQKENFNNSSNSISNYNKNSIELFDDTVVRIKVHKLEFNWKEPYHKNPSKETIGSGFFIDSKGYILTNYHVVKDSIKVFIQLPKYGADTFECRVNCVYPKLDIALIKVDVNELKKKNINYKYLLLGDSEKLRKGSDVVAVGYPLGQNKIKITRGVVSGFQDGDIQTDSAINPGNSGGPLVYNGKVIGINYAGYNDAQNVGYAIPIEYVKINMELLFNSKFINFPIIGATFNNSNETMLKVKSICDNGYYISQVFEGSSFDLAGIKKGDIICSFDGLPIDNYGEVYLKNLGTKFHISNYLKYKKAGDKITTIISRYENKKVVKLKKTIKLIDDKFYKIRTLYPKYDKVEYQNIGGLVIMPLTNNHLRNKEFDNLLGLQKYKLIEGKLEEKLIITNIIKGSKISENEIIKAPAILKEVNGIKVKNMIELRTALHMIHEKDNIKYISFLTEKDKFIILELENTKKEELFLSEKFNYPLTDFTKKLLQMENKEVKTKKENNNNKSNSQTNENIRVLTNNNLENIDDLKKDIYTLMKKNKKEKVIYFPSMSPSQSDFVESEINTDSIPAPSEF